MFGLQWIDLLVIFAYFAVIILIGVRAARRVKNQEDYFLGGRRFGKVIQIFAAFGQGTSADNAVGVTTTVYSQGAAGLWSGLTLLFSTPVFWLTAPWYRRLRLLTLGDFFKERFGSRWMAIVYAVIGSIGIMGLVSLGIGAMAKTVVALTPKDPSALTVLEEREVAQATELSYLEGHDFARLEPAQRDRLRELQQARPRAAISHLDENRLIYAVSIIIIIYGAFGGLHAAFLTDLVQGVFIIILSILLLPFGIAKTNALFGGDSWHDAFATLHRELPQSTLEFFGSPIAMDFTWYFILALCLMSTFNVAVQPNQLVAMGSAKDERTARVGFVTGMLMKRTTTILWGIFALFAILLYADVVRNPDLVWGVATLDLLAPVGLGLVGLMIACLLSALMSTADALMITASSLITHNVFNEFWPGRAEKSLVWWGRLYGVIFILGAAVLATSFPDLLSQMKFLWGFFACFAAAFWLGLLWRRASRPAAWASIGVGALLFLVLPFSLPTLFPPMRTAESLLITTADRVVEREYVATPRDVQERETQRLAWTEVAGTGAKPMALAENERFVKRFHIPGQSVFWTSGIRRGPDGRGVGQGQFAAELWLLHALGWDLSGNVYAFNETLKMLLRIVIPFGLLIGLSMLWPQARDRAVERFFVRMRTRVIQDRDTDERLLAAACENPEATRSVLLFPRSQWEFKRWDREAWTGFIVAFLYVAFLAWLITVVIER